MQILVVDDSSTMRRILVKTLERLGYPSSIEAANGREALERLESTPTDLIIVDWNMPGMSGLELVRAIRSTPATQDTPILMVTGNAGSEDVVRAVRSGITGYVVKPFSSETLRAKISAVLADQEAIPRS
jgi:two-component system, chemotaxis family, chemotaxis protein CheY